MSSQASWFSWASDPHRNGDTAVSLIRTRAQCLSYEVQHVWAPFSSAFLSVIRSWLYFQCLSPKSMFYPYRAPWCYSLAFLLFFFMLLFPLSQRTCPIMSITHCPLQTPHTPMALPSCPGANHIRLPPPPFQHLPQPICTTVVYVYVCHTPQHPNQ